MSDDETSPRLSGRQISDESLWPSRLGWFDLTLPNPADNLSLDDILLAEVERNHAKAILRFWELDAYCVVLGRSNRAELEVDVNACRDEGIPILRRSSGGGAVVLGPGCLAFSLVLPLTDSHRVLGVSALTGLLMNRIALGLRAMIPSAASRGTSDLTAADQKFSGNSQRWLKGAFLHHGTFLYDFDLDVIERVLRRPSREPDYRAGRSHRSFVRNVDLPRSSLIDAMVRCWVGSPVQCDEGTLLRARELAQTRYSAREWNYLI